MRRFTTYMVYVLLALTAVSCQTKSKEVINNITNEKPLVIDVRELDEYAMGHIQGSINIPLSIVVDSIDMIKAQEHVVLVCRSGHRSGLAVDALQTLGLNNVSNGGGWTDYARQIADK